MFVDSDTVNEFKSEDGAVHIIERRCKLDIDAPRLLKKVPTGTLRPSPCQTNLTLAASVALGVVNKSVFSFLF